MIREGVLWTPDKPFCTRRSIRAYLDQPVPKELVQQILTAAMYAPDAGNAQPWQFVVVNDRKLLQRIPKVHPHAPMADNPAGGPGLRRPGHGEVSGQLAPGLLRPRKTCSWQPTPLGLGSVWTGYIRIKAGWRASGGCSACPRISWPTRSSSWVTPRSSPRPRSDAGKSRPFQRLVGDPGA